MPPSHPGKSPSIKDPFIELSMKGYGLIAATDEVMRGCLAGPVVAAAVIMPFPCGIEGIRDSKKLTDKKRRILSAEIKKNALSWNIQEVSVSEIDTIGIQRASILAMTKAVKNLSVKPEFVLIDGKISLPLPIPQKGFIRGDDISIAIGAASIIAKVYRDDLMIELDKTFPGYGFPSHKGYGTELHCSLIKRLGPSTIHRTTFAKVKEFV